MLKPAILYKTQLSWMIPKAASDPHYKFWFGSYVQFEMEIENSSWNKIQMVSVDKTDGINGLFSADIERSTYSVSNFGMINFNRKPTHAFAFDMRDFLFHIFLWHKFNKIVWKVSIGNPAESIYDGFCERYGGRIVGVLEKNIKLLDGVLYDEKLYEITLNNFQKVMGEKKLIRLRSAHGW